MSIFEVAVTYYDIFIVNIIYKQLLSCTGFSCFSGQAPCALTTHTQKNIAEVCMLGECSDSFDLSLLQLHKLRPL